MIPDPETLAAARLACAIDGPLATITLNAPDRRNAQVPSMWRTLEALGRGLPDEIAVVVLRGAGDCFSAGLDLGLLSPDGVPGEESVAGLMTASDAEIIDTIDDYQRGFTWLRDPRFITIAQVHGFAIGAGFQLALSCDLRVVAEDAWFCMKEPALGLVPDLTGTQPLVQLAGYARAVEVCATARRLPAAEAAEWGLVTRTAPAEDLAATTADLVQSLLANDAGAVRATKRLLQEAGSGTLEEQRLRERTAQVGRFRALSGGAGADR